MCVHIYFSKTGSCLFDVPQSLQLWFSSSLASEADALVGVPGFRNPSPHACDSLPAAFVPESPCCCL